jgi:hypothetical protein
MVKANLYFSYAIRYKAITPTVARNPLKSGIRLYENGAFIETSKAAERTIRDSAYSRSWDSDIWLLV